MSGSVTTKKVKRTPKSFSSLFMKQNGNVSDLAMGPNSCIEPAEYIMQCQSGVRYSHGLQPLWQPHQVSKRFLATVSESIFPRRS